MRLKWEQKRRSRELRFEYLQFCMLCVCCNAQESYTLKSVWENSGKATTWYIMTQHSSYFLNETLLCNLDVLFCKADRLQFLCIFQEVVFTFDFSRNLTEYHRRSHIFQFHLDGFFESSGVLVSLGRKNSNIFTLGRGKFRSETCSWVFQNGFFKRSTNKPSWNCTQKHSLHKGHIFLSIKNWWAWKGWQIYCHFFFCF